MSKLTIVIKRYSNQCMFIAGGLIILAALCSKVFHIAEISSVLYFIAFLLSAIPIVLRAIQALKFKTVSIELLVCIASVSACFISEFSESAIVTFLFQFGSFLEQKTIRKTRSAIKELTEMAPKTAIRISSGDESLISLSSETEEIDADEVELNDILLLKTGCQTAADGVVIKGEGYVTESSITGEFSAKHKTVGDHVFAGSIIDSGSFLMKANKVGEDTTFSKIIALVEEAQDAKSPAERFIDKFAKYYTPGVIVISALVLLLTRNLDTSITVLVLACPGALVIGAPIANVAGIGRGAREGILLKGGDSIHTFSKTDTIVFDKTGTLTEGHPQVVCQINYTSAPLTILSYAVSLEKTSEHPLAKAIVRYGADSYSYDLDTSEVFKGRGICGYIDSHQVLVGNLSLMEAHEIPVSSKIINDIRQISETASSIVLISVDNSISMLLGISDTIKPNAARCISSLKKLGIRKIIMLTGDNQQAASSIANSVGIAEYHSNLLPEDKLKMIHSLQSNGNTVTFVGDGINDSPSITAADTGIAMGSGTDVAIESSDVVLIRSNLDSLSSALSLSKRTVMVLYENILISVGTVILLLIGLFAGYIHMSIGMLIHEASILAVIFNAMRLLIKERKSTS